MGKEVREEEEGIEDKEVRGIREVKEAREEIEVIEILINPEVLTKRKKSILKIGMTMKIKMKIITKKKRKHHDINCFIFNRKFFWFNKYYFLYFLKFGFNF